MTKEYYEFLFNLRASGLTHHTYDEIRRLTYQARMLSNPGFHITTEKDGIIVSEELDGDIGVFSEENIINWRNSLIGLATALFIYTSEDGVDLEKAGAFSDYYINLAETIRNAADFNRITEQMFADVSDLRRQHSSVSYGRTVDRCIQYINQQLYTRLTVNDVAKRMGYAPTYLSTLFKEKTGQTLYSYIQHAKIEEAKCMLIATDRLITEISNGLCFHSLSHFSKAFKAAEGMSPQQYRDSGGKKE